MSAPRAHGGDGDSAQRTTLAQIAVDASVSLSTVSKVLNGRPGIAEETRRRVEALLTEHGYERQNTDRPAQLIEMLVAEIDAWTMELIRGVEEVGRASGLATMLTMRDDKHALGEGWLERTIARRPAGVILVFADLPEHEKTTLRAEGIPFALIDPLSAPADDVVAVGSANWYGAVLAIEHLLGHGHRRIATITGPMDMLSSRARLAGYRTALEEAGVAQRTEYVAIGTYYRAEAVSLADALLRLPEPPTAIFAMNDVQALGVYEAAAHLGVSIPTQLSVVGFDDLDIAEWAGPPLTTVRQPLHEMGSVAARLVLEPGDLPFDRASHLDLATCLVVRQSTGAISQLS